METPGKIGMMEPVGILRTLNIDKLKNKPMAPD
jgi:hypothetical protein